MIQAPPMDATPLPAISQSQPPKDMPPPMMHHPWKVPPPLTYMLAPPSTDMPPPIVHGDGGSEVHWPLGPNPWLVFFLLHLPEPTGLVLSEL